MSLEDSTPTQRLFKWKFVILGAWIVIAIALFLLTTPLSTVIDKKGKVSLPDSTLTSTATSIQQDHNMNSSDIKSFAIVFSSANQLTDSEKNEISQITKSINEEKEALNITSINSPTETPDLKDQLEAKDGKSIVLSGSANMDNQSAATLQQNLEKKLENTSLNTYITGKMFIDDISNKQTEQGVKKGLIIALVLFVLASLILIRKIFPIIITLILSVITFIATTSIYSILAQNDLAKATSLTPIVAGAVIFLFTVIYVYSYFFEYSKQVNRLENLNQAITATTHSKLKSTIVSSLILAIVGFGFAFTTFQMYKSFFIVFIAAILIALSTLTLLPIIFRLFGSVIFFPGTAKGDPAFLSRFAAITPKRSAIVVLVALIALIPSLTFLQSKESYSTLDGLPEDEEAVIGYRFIEKNYSLGSPLPITLYLEGNDNWNTTNGMTFAEGLSRQLAGLSSVDSVRSPSRPYGKELDPLLVTNQLTTLKDGIVKGNDGVKQVNTGLSGAKDQLDANAPKLKEATDGITRLITGTGELQNGLGQLTDGLRQLEAGLRKGSIGGNQLKAGMLSAKENTGKLLDGSKALLAGYKQVEGGLGELATGVQALKGGFGTAKDGFGLLQTKFGDVQKGFGDLKTGFGTVQNGFGSLKTGFGGVQGGFTQVKTGFGDVQTGFGGVQGGFTQVKTGFGDVQTGFGDVQGGFKDVKSGFGGVQTGFGLVQGGFTQVQDGFTGVQTGYKKVQQGFGGLKDGFSGVATGATTLSSKFNTAMEDDIPLLRNSVSTISKGATKFDASFTEIKGGVDTALNLATELMKNPALAADPTIKQLVGTLQQVSAGSTDYSTKFNEFVKGTNLLDTGVNGADGLYNQLISFQDGLDNLVVGTNKVSTGFDNLSTGIGEFDQGLNMYNSGLTKFNNEALLPFNAGLSQFNGGLDKFNNEALLPFNAGLSQFNGGLDKFNNEALLPFNAGLNQFNGGLDKFNNEALLPFNAGLNQFSGGLTTFNSGMDKFNQGLGLYSAGLSQFSGGLGMFEDGIAKAEAGINALRTGINTANNLFPQVVDGQEKLVAGLGQLYAGISELAAGVETAANGQTTILSKVPAFANGLTQIKDGQIELGDGIGLFVDKVGELQTGLGDATNGLTQIYTGLTGAQSYLSGVSSAADKTVTGWYIPEDALAKEEFSLIFDTYLSDDSKVMKVDLNLNGNPLTNDGEEAIDSIVSTTQTYLDDMGLNDTRIGVGGDPATVFDLKSIQQPEKVGENLNDLLWMVLYCTIAIFIVLAVAYRSIFLPLIYLCSAAFVYLVSFAAIYYYFVNMGDYVGIKFVTTMLGILLIVPIVLSLFIHSRMDKGDEQSTLSYTSIVSSIIIAISFIGFLLAGNIMFVQAALAIVIGFTITALFVLPLLLPALRRK